MEFWDSNNLEIFVFLELWTLFNIFNDWNFLFFIIFFEFFDSFILLIEKELIIFCFLLFFGDVDIINFLVSILLMVSVVNKNLVEDVWEDGCSRISFLIFLIESKSSLLILLFFEISVLNIILCSLLLLFLLKLVVLYLIFGRKL